MTRSPFLVVAFALFLTGIGDFKAIAASSGTSVSTLSIKELSKIAKTTDGRRFYTGDIIIYRKEVSEKAAAGAPLWTKGRLVYQFSGQSSSEQAIFLAACNAWAATTPVVCVPRTNEPNFTLVVTHNGEGCGGQAWVSCSAIGMVGGQQELQVYSGHWNFSTQWVIEHEIGHAYGLIHEQSRTDRDGFVIINYGNITSGNASNFDIWPYSQNATDYDYKSIMHYNNCEFSTNPSKCNPSDRNTEQYWTISPVPCSLGQVGGQSITNLDFEGINKLYGGPIHALYAQYRSAQCGVHQYSAAQVVQACGSGCAAAAPVQWTRVTTDYDWGCGWLPVKNGPGVCTARKQEFIEQHFDKTFPSWKCWGGTLVERYINCGCSSQQLNAQCANYSAGIDLLKLEKLLQSNDPKTRSAAHFAKTLLSYRDRNYLDHSLAGDLPQILLAAYVRGDETSLSGILCEIQARLTIGRLVSRSYVIDRKRLNAIASRYAFSL